MSHTIVNIKNWPRREHFEFFSQFDEPFFGVNVKVDFTGCYLRAKQRGESFFIHYMHAVLKALNQVENLKYRIQGDAVVLYESIGVSATIARDSGTFGFSHIPFYKDFDGFLAAAKEEILRVQARTDLQLDVAGDDVVHFSALPWLDFTSISHARNFKFQDSCPKISVGKLTETDGKYFMPVSIHVHHGLADGIHVGQFVQHLQNEVGGV